MSKMFRSWSDHAGLPARFVWADLDRYFLLLFSTDQRTILSVRSIPWFLPANTYVMVFLVYLHDWGASYPIMLPHGLTLSQTSPGFLRVCSTSPLKTLWEKEKLLVTSNFSFSHTVSYPFGELSASFIKFRFVVCELFQFGRVWNVLFGKGLNT